MVSINPHLSERKGGAQDTRHSPAETTIYEKG